MPFLSKVCILFGIVALMMCCRQKKQTKPPCHTNKRKANHSVTNNIADKVFGIDYGTTNSVIAIIEKKMDGGVSESTL